MSYINLEDRLHLEVDYTFRDDVIFTLLEVTKCPIMLESSHDMILFNNHLYDRFSFDEHRKNESIRNQRKSSSGYRGDDANRLKDPRTGENLNYTFALRTLFTTQPVRDDFIILITNRIRGLTDEQAMEFIPRMDDDGSGIPQRNVSNFINHLQTLSSTRVNNQRSHQRHIEHLQNDANMQLPVASPRPVSRTPINTRGNYAHNVALAIDADALSVSSDSVSLPGNTVHILDLTDPQATTATTRRANTVLHPREIITDVLEEVNIPLPDPIDNVPLTDPPNVTQLT